MMTILAQVAVKIGDAAGRKIEHVHLSEEESCQRYAKLGMPQHLAKFLSHIEALCAQGFEERSGGDVEKVTGRPPQNFDTWVQHYKTVWQ